MDAQRIFERQGACLLAHSDNCWVWQFRNESGDGTMTVYQVFPGVILSFNDFHMERYDCSFVSQGRMLAIDHCREGRMEYAVGDNLVGYTAAGDMKLDLRRQHTGVFSFPSCHYHGLMVGFDLDLAARELAEQVRDFPVTPEKLLERWALADTPRVVHGAQGTEHIFGELYHVPEKIRMPYFRLKILELLLCLDAMTIPADASVQPYFYKSQAEKVKAIRRFLMEHVAENFTQEELSARFDIPMTAMKAFLFCLYPTRRGSAGSHPACPKPRRGR